MKTPAVVVHETPNLEMLAKPRARKLYGHTMTDYTIKLRGYNKVDRRKLPHAHGMGRPYYKAMIGIFDDTELYEQFHDILKGLVYREQMALARAFGVHYNTILNWTKNKTDPGADIIIQVVEWDKAGKPIEKVRPGIDDDRSAVCPNMVNELARCIHPGRPLRDMPLIEQLAIYNYQQQKHEQSLKTQRPATESLHKTETYNPFAEVYPNPWDDDGE